MKHFFIFLTILCTIVLNAQETQYISNYRTYNLNEIMYLFGNNVHLRAEPSANSQSIKLLPIGSKLIILQEFETVDGNNNPVWVKVRHRDTIGYIRSDYISLLTTSINDTPLYTQLKYLEDTSILLIRIPTNQEKAYIEKSFNIENSTLALEVSGNKGLSRLNHIIHINYLAEACGVEGGGKYIFIKDDKWIEAFSYSQVSDADIFYWWEELTFPEEHKQGEFILYRSEFMETVYEDNDYNNPMDKKTQTIEKKLYWDGYQIYPKFKQEAIFDNN